MLSQTALVAVLGLAASSSAHMIMATPVPYGKSSLNNSPLAADGSDFPCKQRSGVYDADGASNSMALGSSQPLSFTGSATHGGGSCQISITYDKEPTKSSTFKVIHSIEGGCPVQGAAGNIGDDANAVDPSTYNFTIPTSLPAGDATLAWTWFNKVGNREMYMNCAPVTLTGGSSKRSSARLDARDQAAYSALPDMFVANLGSGCTTVDSADLAFPDPGDSLDQLGMATAKPVAPQGSCAAAAPAATGSSSGAAAASGAASQVTSAASSVAGSATGAASAGTFATGSGASSAAVSGAASSQVATSASTAATVASTGSASSSNSSGSASGSTAGSTAGGLTGACTSEGMWNCIGGSSFQQCASGQWSAVQAMAAGTTCTAGQAMNLSIARRSIRFSI